MGSNWTLVVVVVGVGLLSGSSKPPPASSPPIPNLAHGMRSGWTGFITKAINVMGHLYDNNVVNDDWCVWCNLTQYGSIS